MPKQKTEFDSELVREIAEIMSETGLSEVELKQGDRRLRLSRLAGAPAPVAAAAPAAAAPPAPAGQEPADSAESIEDHPGTVPSPMVGTAYLSPQPGDDAFVRVGDSVEEGQTLMIIEAMKVMNPIPAPRAGTVKAILISDAQPVEFGDPLAIIE